MPIYVLLILSVLWSTAVFAEDLGRLFTTPGQRSELDALRYQKEPVEIKIDTVNDKVNKTDEKEKLLESITVKGLIYRKDGKSTAWINSSNTLEGDLALQDIEVKSKDISTKEVGIILPGDNEVIRLRVGEKYLPSTGEKVDLTPR